MKHFIEEDSLDEDYSKNVTLHYEDYTEEDIKHFKDEENFENNDNCITHFNE